jgi:hypothetical protein
MPATLNVTVEIPATPEGMYDLYHSRYYKKVYWMQGEAKMQGFTFKHRFFKSQENAKKEAKNFGTALGQSTAIIQLPDGRFSFLPSNQNQDTAIERMCRMLGARIVDYVTVWSL